MSDNSLMVSVEMVVIIVNSNVFDFILNMIDDSDRIFEIFK